MNRKQKQIIQSAAIRFGVGVLAILTGYFFLTEAEMYQKACYAFGYFFAAYTLVMEALTAIFQKKQPSPEKIVTLVATITSIACILFGYYKTAITIMLGALVIDTVTKCSNAAKWKPYPLYIFDLDGTIADTLESMGHTCNLVLQDLGLAPQPLEAYKTFVGDAVAKLIERALLAAGDATDENGMPVHQEEALNAYLTKFADSCTYGVAAYGEMKNTLEILKEENAKLAVFTNKRHPYAVKVVEKVYGKGFFDYILGEGNGFSKKPSPEGALHIAQMYGIQPQHCVYIGDTNTDMETGLAAGMYTVGVTWGFRSKAELEAYNPAKIISNPKELLEITVHP